MKKIDYSKIPAVAGCRPGCTDCCGPVPFAPAEVMAAVEASGRWPFVDADCNCGYSLKGKCDIYEVRPLICRLFGAVDDPGLACPHGARAARPLSAEEGGAMTDELVRGGLTMPGREEEK